MNQILLPFQRRMRYQYLNKAYIDSGAPHGINCDPVKKNGKCIIGKKPRNQLVKFEDGTLAVVIARRLRLNQG